MIASDVEPVLVIPIPGLRILAIAAGIHVPITCLILGHFQESTGSYQT
jgi:hypothetical protein